MAKRRSVTLCPREPIGLSATEAATFIGVSETHFRKAVENGLLPPAVQLFGRCVWLADELIAALKRLPRQTTLIPYSDDPDTWGEISV